MTYEQFVAYWQTINKNKWKTRVADDDDPSSDLIVGTEVDYTCPKDDGVHQMKLDDSVISTCRATYGSLPGKFGIWVIPVVC